MLLKRSTDQPFLNRVLETRAGLWVPGQDIVVPKHRNVLAILGTPRGKILIPASNIVGDAGDLYYAQSAVGEAVTNAFDSGYLSSVAWGTGPNKTTASDDIASMIASVEKLVSATYPKTNDGDGDNTGAGTDIVTWLFSWAKADFNDADIEAGAISLPTNTSWGGAGGNDPILTGFAFTAFAKTADDTLKVFVNHQMNGV